MKTTPTRNLPQAHPDAPQPPGHAESLTGGAHPRNWGKGRESPEEGRFLEGPQPRTFELGWALRIFWELMRGLRALHFVGPCVTVFGSARFPEDHPYYGLAREMGRRLGRAGFTVMTGGGPGIMEAANRGAQDVGARSVGCNIVLPQEQSPNPYLDLFVEFHWFFVRKQMLIKYSYAFVVLPGGFGTMDEIFEAVTLIQTGKIKRFPLILMGTEYWAPLMDFLRDRMVTEKTIAPEDVERVVCTDSPDEAMDRIMAAATGEFGLRWERTPKPSRALGEVGLTKRSTGPFMEEA